MSLYDASVPQFDKMLGNLSTWLDQSVEWASARDMDPELLLETRLFPDMMPLRRQVQVACDTAKLGSARMVDIEAPNHEDGPQSIAELQARIAEVRAFISDIDASAVDPERVFSPPFASTMRVTVDAFVREFSVPNFYFHLNMSYALLRSVGVPLGKRAYIGSMSVET